MLKIHNQIRKTKYIIKSEKLSDTNCKSSNILLTGNDLHHKIKDNQQTTKSQLT